MNNLEQISLLLRDLDSVWLTYATKEKSKGIDEYKLEIFQRLTNDEELSSRLYNTIINKMK